jgi:hypothetical protein
VNDTETEETLTISERIIARYPAHNWSVIDDDTLRLEAGDAHIEVGAYVVDGEYDAEEIRADLEVNHMRGGEITMGEVSLDDLPGAIGQGLAVLHALDLATTGEPFNVDWDAVPEWAVEAFVKQADEVSCGMDDLSYLKTYDTDRYARRYVLAEHARQRQKWPVEHDDEHDEPKPALAAAAWWLTLPTEARAVAPEFVPAWAVELKNKVAAEWTDPEAAHEVCCIKAAALLLAEIARCRRARRKAEKAANAAADRAAEEKAQP